MNNVHVFVAIDKLVDGEAGAMQWADPETLEVVDGRNYAYLTSYDMDSEESDDHMRFEEEYATWTEDEPGEYHIDRDNLRIYNVVIKKVYDYANGWGEVFYAHDWGFAETLD